MIIKRTKLYSSSENFKPKFRARFRRGDFTYTQAKDPKNEAFNHQAYREVAAEDEFKNNPETYKIRQGVFSVPSEKTFASIRKIKKAGKMAVKNSVEIIEKHGRLSPETEKGLKKIKNTLSRNKHVIQADNRQAKTEAAKKGRESTLKYLNKQLELGNNRLAEI